MYFDHLKFKLNEMVSVKEYPVQAIGRKRNVFVNTLALNEEEFSNWVQDRLYRVAQRNKVPVKSLNYKDIVAGLQAWKETFQKGDPKWNEFSGAYEEYRRKFLAIAEKHIKNNIQTNAPVKKDSTFSPKMLKTKSST